MTEPSADVAARQVYHRPQRTAHWPRRDVDKDGYTDFLLGRADATGIFVQSDGQGRFRQSDRTDVAAGVTAALFIDYDNDGLLDLITAGRRTVRLFEEPREPVVRQTQGSAVCRARRRVRRRTSQSLSFGDLDRDGDLDGLVLLANGALSYWRNEGGNRIGPFVRLVDASAIVSVSGRR